MRDALMYNCKIFESARQPLQMEAEQLNLIETRLKDLLQRQHALRGYL